MRPHRPSPTLVALALLVAAAASGCASTTPGASGGAVASPGSSGGAAACPTAPEPSSMDGWQGAAQTPTVIPYLISNQVTCGQTRIMFSLLDKDNRPAAAPDRPLSIAFYDLGKDPSTPVTKVDGTFIWAIEGQRGVYAADVDLPEAGTWGLEFTTSAPGGPSETIRATMDVLESSSVVKVGDHAPSIKSPTLADVGGDASKISTDPKPDPAFYQTSIADAIAAHKPFILVFATPKFCTSQQCGPTLDRIKPVAAANPAVTFINVEPYRLHDVDGQLQPILDANGQLQSTDVTKAWGLYTEPWIFAVDADGAVRASYELIASDQEIQDAIAAITKPS